MIKFKSILIIIFISFFNLDSTEAKLNLKGSHNIVPTANLRIIYQNLPWTTLFEAQNSYHSPTRSERSFRLGGYHRPKDWLKLGLFYELAFGNWHDNDLSLIGDRFVWAKVNSRDEHIGIVDITAAQLLDFISPQLKAELKTRYQLSSINDEQTIRIRPGLQYFLLSNEKPCLTFTLQWEGAFPLNYAEHTLYEMWIYFTTTLNITKSLEVGPKITHRHNSWGSNHQFEVSSHFTEVGILLIYRFLP